MKKEREMAGYTEYYTVVYRDDQRMVILNDNPAERKKKLKLKTPPKRGVDADRILKGASSHRDFWRSRRH
jgi:hypothetical protein